MADDPASPDRLETASKLLHALTAIGLIAAIGLRLGSKVSTGEMLIAMLLCVQLYGGAVAMGWIAARAAARSTSGGE